MQNCKNEHTDKYAGVHVCICVGSKLEAMSGPWIPQVEYGHVAKCTNVQVSEWKHVQLHWCRSVHVGTLQGARLCTRKSVQLENCTNGHLYKCADNGSAGGNIGNIWSTSWRS